jgi:hypothetical protein
MILGHPAIVHLLTSPVAVMSQSIVSSLVARSVFEITLSLINFALNEASQAQTAFCVEHKGTRLRC